MTMILIAFTLAVVLSAEIYLIDRFAIYPVSSPVAFGFRMDGKRFASASDILAELDRQDEAQREYLRSVRAVVASRFYQSAAALPEGSDSFETPQSILAKMAAQVREMNTMNGKQLAELSREMERLATDIAVQSERARRQAKEAPVVRDVRDVQFVN